MPSGLLGKAALAANTVTEIFSAPLGKVVTTNINVCNTTAAVVSVRIAVGTGAAPAASDWLEYDAKIPAGGVIERTGIAMTAGEKVWVHATAANVAVRAHGFEEEA